jgi:hypothetical protein
MCYDGHEKYIYRVLVGKPEGKETLLKHWIRSEDSIEVGTAGGLL